ncbi:MAG TPA: hypothetical protein VI793_13370 [Anaerolineales bacterium]|nr:hypothetical protein [Anaerolineales bacterium]
MMKARWWRPNERRNACRAVRMVVCGFSARFHAPKVSAQISTRLAAQLLRPRADGFFQNLV